MTRPSGDGAPADDEFPPLSPGVLFSATPNGGVVYDLVDEQLTWLNPSGALLLDACSRRRHRDAAIEQWAAGAEGLVERIRMDVDRALATFRSIGFVARRSALPKRFLPDAPVTPLDRGETATVQAAGVHRIRFRSHDPDLVDAVTRTLDLACDDPPTADFHLSVAEGGAIRLITDTEWRFPHADRLVAALVMVVNDFVARSGADVVLHAATLQDPDGRTVLFPAPPGSGKSTLTAVLLRAGWAYLGDESATIRTTDQSVVPCAKPLGLDATSCEVVGLPCDLAGDVAPRALGSSIRVVRAPAPSPSAIILPRFVGPNGAFQRGRLDFDDALTALVRNALNLRYVGVDGLETLVELAATVPVTRIEYRSTDEALDGLAEAGLLISGR